MEIARKATDQRTPCRKFLAAPLVRPYHCIVNSARCLSLWGSFKLEPPVTYTKCHVNGRPSPSCDRVSWLLLPPLAVTLTAAATCRRNVRLILQAVILMFGEIFAVLFGRIRIHYLANHWSRMQYKRNIRYRRSLCHRLSSVCDNRFVLL